MPGDAITGRTSRTLPLLGVRRRSLVAMAAPDQAVGRARDCEWANQRVLDRPSRGRVRDDNLRHPRQNQHRVWQLLWKSGPARKPTEVLRQAQRAYDAGDVDALSDLLAPDVVRVNNSAPAVVGRDAFLDVAAMQRRLFPDVMVERTHWVEEDEWVAFQFRATGTNSVEAPGLPA